MPTGIAVRRLSAQHLIGEPFASAVDAVAVLGAVQAQDYAGAKWALGQRTGGATEADIDRLCDTGAILRTHVLRPTWHFVLPEDIRWLLRLTAPRVKAKTALYDRRLGVDGDLIRGSHRVIEAALEGGRSLTRAEIRQVLELAGIAADGPRLGYLLMHAELDGLVVNGPRRGKQVTYALLEERAPRGSRTLDPDRDEALAELTRRYFVSHGPAQLQDFAWWSGLTIADGRRGIAMIGNSVRAEVIERKSYWSAADVAAPSWRPPAVHLLPNYDELLVAYRDRSAAVSPGLDLTTAPFPLGSLLAHTVVVNGQVWGGWTRRLSPRSLIVQIGEEARLGALEASALRRAADQMSRFAGIEVRVLGIPS